MGYGERYKDAVETPQNERAVEGEAKQTARVGQRDSPVREVAVDAGLGLRTGM